MALSTIWDKKLVLPRYEDLRHFLGYLYEILFKNLQYKDVPNKKITVFYFYFSFW
jgi:hypothetical protein